MLPAWDPSLCQYFRAVAAGHAVLLALHGKSASADMLVLLHPLQHLFTLRWFPTRSGQQIHDELARSDAAKTIALDRPVEGDRIERLKKHDFSLQRVSSRGS